MAKTLTNLNNRKSRQEIKATVATTDPLADYENRRTSFWGELIIQGLPPWYLWIGRAMLDSDPLVRFAINVRNAALMPAEITVKAKNEMYAAWIQKQWDFLWNHHRSKFTSAKKYGFSALQAIWKLDERDYLTLTDCKDYSPEDSKCLLQDNRIVGMTVKSKKVFSPQALWMTFGSEFGNPYGTGILRRMYPAWFEKWMNHGAKKLLQLRMLKDAYIGDIFWYPPDQIVEIPDGQGGVKSMPWRDVFREIGENRTSGNVLTLPLLLDSNGKELTRYTPPQDTGSASQIFEWNDLVDSKILQAADVPREVIEAAETGSGYSGRSIPFLTMLSVCNDELVEMVQCFRRLIEPVIWLNWGVEPDFEIIPSNLVETFSDDTQGSPMGGGAIGGQPGQQPPVQLLPAPQQGQQQFEEEDEQFAEFQYAENEHNHQATELTHERGTHPIPEGHIRAFHYTRGDVDSIKKHGLKLDHARGHTYGEPNMIWGSSNQPDHHHNVVEFHIPHNDPGIALGGHFQQDHTNWNKGVNHVGMRRDIKPHEILAVHEPWHQQYHYIKKHPDLHKEVLAGKHDHLLNTNGYGRAIEQVKKESGTSQHAEETNGPFRHISTGKIGDKVRSNDGHYGHITGETKTHFHVEGESSYEDSIPSLKGKTFKWKRTVMKASGNQRNAPGRSFVIPVEDSQHAEKQKMVEGIFHADHPELEKEDIHHFHQAVANHGGKVYKLESGKHLFKLPANYNTLHDFHAHLNNHPHTDKFVSSGHDGREHSHDSTYHSMEHSHDDPYTHKLSKYGYKDNGPDSGGTKKTFVRGKGGGEHHHVVEVPADHTTPFPYWFHQNHPDKPGFTNAANSKNFRTHQGVDIKDLYKHLKSVHHEKPERIPVKPSHQFAEAKKYVEGIYHADKVDDKAEHDDFHRTVAAHGGKSYALANGKHLYKLPADMHKIHDFHAALEDAGHSPQNHQLQYHDENDHSLQKHGYKATNISAAGFTKYTHSNGNTATVLPDGNWEHRDWASPTNRGKLEQDNRHDVLHKHLGKLHGKPILKPIKVSSQHSEQFGEHSYCSTQFNLSGSVAEEITALGLQIPDEDLVPTDYGTETKSGRENEIHVTLLWGIH